MHHLDLLVELFGLTQGLLGEVLQLGKGEDLVVFVVPEDDAGGTNSLVIIETKVLFNFVVLRTDLRVGVELVQEVVNHFIHWKKQKLFLVLVVELTLGALERNGLFNRRGETRGAKGVSAIGENSRNSLGSVELLLTLGTFQIVHYIIVSIRL